jgi:archaellum biogenesis ATPase FlaH
METKELSMIEQLAQLRITAKSEIAPHEFLFDWNGVPCFAKGELVAVTGKAKSGKTYLNSLLMAAAGREPSRHTMPGNEHTKPEYNPGLIDKGRFLGLKRRQEEALRVLWIDTEQSEDTTCEILRDRIGAMIGGEPNEERFHVFNMRQTDWRERMTLVLSAIAICKPDLVIFDGIRDVVGDINDYTEAQNIIGQLLKAASEFHPCIVCVLHQNKAVEDKTLRGALGTELQNKSFETYECSKNAETRIFTVKQIATRKYDMQGRIDFCLDKDGLPMGCADSDLTSVEQNKEDASLTSRAQNKEGGFNRAYVGEDGKIDKVRLLGNVLANKSLGWNELRAQLMQKAGIRSPHFAETLMKEARDGGMLQTILINSRREYLLRSQQQLFDEGT